jgi:antitoxin VapB
MDIHRSLAVLARTSLFLLNRSQAVRLPKSVAFADEVREVIIVADGPRRIIAPAEAAWDDFFDAPGIHLGMREQPAMQERERF